jgi:hypothetical protein
MKYTLALALGAFLCLGMFTPQAKANSLPDVPDSVGSAAGFAGTPAISLGAMSAQTSDVMRVKVTEPVQIPGALLQPGTYNFRLMNLDNEVAVSNASRSYGVHFVIPAYRRDAAADGIAFVQKTANGADRITSWFFPGQSQGYAFLYPSNGRRLTVMAKRHAAAPAVGQ